jgi:predicted PurR-regulated permease PerM
LSCFASPPLSSLPNRVAREQHPGMADSDEHRPRHAPAVSRAFARRVVVAVGITLAMVAVALFLWNSLQVLLLAFAAILVGVALRGMAVWLAGKTRLPVGGALAVVILSVVGLFLGVAALVAPAVVQQFDRLADQLPHSIESAQERLRQYAWGRRVLGDTPPDANAEAATTRPSDAAQSEAAASDADAPPAGSSPTTSPTLVAKAIEVTTSRPEAAVGRVARYAQGLASGVFTFVLVVIVGIYLAAQPEMYVRGTLLLFPKRERPRMREVMYEVGYTLRWWLLAQLVPMACIGVLIGGGLWLIGVPLWLPLGLLAALLNFIPNFGPVIAAVPAVLIALADSPGKAMWVIALAIVAQNLEGYLITPMVQRRAVEMPPALTILSQVLMGLLLGPLGVILAAPLMAAGIVVVKMLYVEDALGTPVPVPGQEKLAASSNE